MRIRTAMKSRRLYPRPSPGFTLVELLVVIAVLVVLAALTAIAFGRWNQRAKAVAGVSRVRDLGVTVLSYTTDKGELPVWHDYNQGKYWWQLLADYENVNDPDRFKNNAHSGFDRENPEQTLSFGWNYPVIGRHKGDSGFRVDHVLRLSNFVDPGMTLVLADGPAANCWGYIDGYQNQPDPKRYDGKAAAVFLDGSAKLLETPSEFLADSRWFKPVRPLVPR
jgi:prepilin-type N-terminal cleavage/methylation domain-containing protein